MEIIATTDEISKYVHINRETCKYQSSLGALAHAVTCWVFLTPAEMPGFELIARLQHPPILLP